MRGGVVAELCRTVRAEGALRRVEERRRWAMRVEGTPVAFERGSRLWVDDQGRFVRGEGDAAGGWEARWEAGVLRGVAGGRAFERPEPEAPWVLTVAAPDLWRAGSAPVWDAAALGGATAALSAEGPWRSARWKGGEHRARLDPRGRVVEEAAGPLRWTLDGPGPTGQIEVLDHLGVPLTIAGDPRGARVLVVEVSGGDGLAHGPRQRVEGARIRVEAPFAEEVPRVPTVDPRANGRWPAVAVAPKRRAAVETALREVRAALPHAPTVGPAEAGRLLAGSTGDCTERSALLVEVLAEVGIQARIVSGLLLTGAPRPGAWPHAWVEVWYGEEAGWVGVDPGLGQVEADAGRLALGVGEPGAGEGWLQAGAWTGLRVVEVR